MPNSPSGGKQKLVPMNAIFSSPLPSAHVPFPPSSVRTKEEKRRSAPRGHSSAYLWLHSTGRDSPVLINVKAKKSLKHGNLGRSTIEPTVHVKCGSVFVESLLLPPYPVIAAAALTERTNERTTRNGKGEKTTPPYIQVPLLFCGPYGRPIGERQNAKIAPLSLLPGA